MKKIFTIIKVVLFPALLFSQTSTITGNILVTYNYTTNKADAGAEVRLLSVDKNYLSTSAFLIEDSILKTTCDVLGNFTFKNVTPGTYIVYCNSKSAIATPFNVYNSLISTMAEPIKKMTGFDISSHKPQLKSDIEKLLNESFKFSEDKKWKKYDKTMKEMNGKIDEFISSFPNAIKLFLNIYGGETTAKDFKEINIKSGIDENYAIKFEVRY